MTLIKFYRHHCPHVLTPSTPSRFSDEPSPQKPLHCTSQCHLSMFATFLHRAAYFTSQLSKFCSLSFSHNPPPRENFSHPFALKTLSAKRPKVMKLITTFQNPCNQDEPSSHSRSLSFPRFVQFPLGPTPSRSTFSKTALAVIYVFDEHQCCFVPLQSRVFTGF